MTRNKVLYIEDNPTSLLLVKRTLSTRTELALFTAMTPAEGLKIARREQPSLILLDLDLHGIDGYDVLDEIQKDSHLGSIPVIAVTGKVMPWDVDKGMQAGFSAYLTKPLNLDTLIEKIYETLDSN